MATHNDTCTSISLLGEEQHHHFRLLELPPELLELLTSANPPTLQLKSSPDHGSESEGHAVLCTRNKTYNIRQKNSSNTVYVLQPTEAGNNLDVQRLEIISQPQSTLETTPAPKPCAAAHIRQLLPVIASTGQVSGTREALTKQQLLASIPASDAECEEAFCELTAFENEEHRCVLPSAQLQLQMWEMMHSAARAISIDVTKTLSRGDFQRLHSAMGEVDDVDVSLFHAVFDSIASKPADPAMGGKTIESGSFVRWVGMNRLEAGASKSAITVTSFKAAWKDDLPEPWRGETDLAKLAGRHTLSDGGKSIKFRDYKLDLEEDAGTVVGKDGNAGVGSKRKQWHEKFRPSKKSS